jgi:hypothetical protein
LLPLLLQQQPVACTSSGQAALELAQAALQTSLIQIATLVPFYSTAICICCHDNLIVNQQSSAGTHPTLGLFPHPGSLPAASCTQDGIGCPSDTA